MRFSRRQGRKNDVIAQAEEEVPSFVYESLVPGRGTRFDWIPSKIRTVTSVDWMFKKMAVIKDRYEMQCSFPITPLEGGEGVTTRSPNQLWALDYHRDETLHSGTRFDLRLLIKYRMF